MTCSCSREYRLANTEASELGLVRAWRQELRNEIAAAAADLVRSENSLKEQKQKCGNLQEEIQEIKQEISLIEEQVSSIPAEIIDAEKTKKLLETLREDRKNLKETLKTTESSAKTETQLLEKINDFLTSFDVEEYQKRKEDISSLEGQITNLPPKRLPFEKLKVANKKHHFSVKSLVVMFCTANFLKMLPVPKVAFRLWRVIYITLLLENRKHKR